MNPLCSPTLARLGITKMNKSEKRQFASKQEAFSSLYLWVTIPVASIILGFFAISKASRAYPLPDKIITQGFYVILLQALVISAYACFKLFRAVRAIYKDDFNDLPETSTVICLKCMDPAILDVTNGMTCKKCGGELEELRGFYDRHPELKK